ncbi:MAG: protease modulator HflC [Butyricicoccus sp.]|nr:protease modulator HflC [Butyricicoccus sp.]
MNMNWNDLFDAIEEVKKAAQQATKQEDEIRAESTVVEEQPAQEAPREEPAKKPRREKPVREKKPREPISKAKIIVPVLIVAALFVGLNSLYTVKENQYGYVTRFSELIDIVEEPGLHVKVPFLDEVRTIPSYQMLYDIPPSEVITADKKTLVIDNFAVWQVTDPAKYVRTVSGSQPQMESRISASVYSAIKNEFGRLQRDEIINTDSSSVEQVALRVTSTVDAMMQRDYGVTIRAIEIKRTDLPTENAESVYSRMISDREKIAASYLADGNLEAAKIRNNADKEAATILAEARAQAEILNGEAEAEYMRILANAYSGAEKAEFYVFLRELDAMKAAMAEGNRTLILDETSEIARILLGTN